MMVFRINFSCRKQSKTIKKQTRLFRTLHQFAGKITNILKRKTGQQNRFINNYNSVIKEELFLISETALPSFRNIFDYSTTILMV